MHGSESNTKNTLNKLISELETYNSNIPSDKTVIVIPTINPDGIANKSRFNANGVDLNRNFDNSNWVSGTYFLNDFYPNGGGLVPFSEPESVAIKNLVERESPYLTISYHSAAGYVIPNNTLTAIELGNIYSQLSGYRYIAPGTEGAFTYDITGTFERWAQENGHNALVIELSSAYNDQFSLNKIAMWDMIKR
jgi:protein MpaA